ncbi:uncharacterized protein LOC128754990 isoform X1 [Synchiropus splendidus]|uniref:uncharacterized protein LOC128754990 isoform X1 n=1 Tax=Synchiropus splendidus TaxID=270530 RepID=UPI00237DF6C4|nr:uncharacterized protein LOC128754990 isoform X1 [Synchiropus splendidus]
MDPDKTLTFCLGLKAEEMTMSLIELGRSKAVTMATPTKDAGIRAVNEQVVASSKYCPGVDNDPGYLCETGHCCGESGCCTYYYELWWFWLLWTVLILFICLCAFRHRRAKLRIQQQQRQREINLIAYNGASNYPPSMLDLSFLSSLKLPSYEEVAAQPETPPPPYSSVFALRGGAVPDPCCSHPHHHCPPYLAPSTLASSQSSDNFTSCSCDSCSLSSPCSTSFSVQVTDETCNSSHVSSPSPTGGDSAVFPSLAVCFTSGRPSQPQVLCDVRSASEFIPKTSYSGSREVSTTTPPLTLPLPPLNTSHHRLPLSPHVLLSALPGTQVQTPAFPDPLGALARKQKEGTPSPPNQASYSSNMSVVLLGRNEYDEEDEEEDHFRHRCLTGDSGIEVCRCHVKRDAEKEAEKENSRAAAAALSPGQHGFIPSTSSFSKRSSEAFVAVE